jgi:hypothetical protein
MVYNGRFGLKQHFGPHVRAGLGWGHDGIFVGTSLTVGMAEEGWFRRLNVLVQ